MKIFETKEFKKLLSKDPKKALTFVYENFHQEARAICFSKFSNVDQVEEALSIAWERLIVRFQPGKPKFRGDCKFSTYLYTVFSMACAQVMRSKQRRKIEVYETVDIITEKTPETPLLRLCIDEDLQAVLNYALTDFDRKVLKLRVDKEMTLSECAKRLKVSEAKLKSRVRRLGIKIKECQEKDGKKKAIVLNFQKAYLEKKRKNERSKRHRSSDTERMLGNC